MAQRVSTKKPFFLGDTFFNQLGKLIVRTVRKDAIRGIMQNGFSNLKYKSKKYVQYKMNSMRRIRSGGKLNKNTNRLNNTKNSTKLKFNKRTKTFSSGNRKLKGFEGISTNTETAFVNLHLTSNMMKDYDVVKYDAKSVEIGWSSDKEAQKVKGNKARGYDVTGLNDYNLAMVTKHISDALDRKGIEWSKEDIVIKIK